MKGRKELVNEQTMDMEKKRPDAVSNWENDNNSEALKPSDPSVPPGPEDAKKPSDSRQDDEEIPPEPHKQPIADNEKVDPNVDNNPGGKWDPNDYDPTKL